MPESVALKKFRESLGLADELLGLEASFPDPPPPVDEAKVRGLRGGAAVLMVAAFEGYLNSGVAELLKPLLGPPHKPLSSLPSALRTASVFESLEFALKGPRHGQSSEKVDRLPDITAAAARIVAGQIDPHALSQTKSNPGPQAVERLLKNLGIKNPFGHIRPTFDGKWGRPEAATFVVDKLEEIVQRRHRVAHAADTLAIGRSDLALASKFLSALAETIDLDLQAYISSL